MKTLKKGCLLRALPASVLLLLAACGGGGDDAAATVDSDPRASVPIGASQSVEGMTGYIASLASSDDEAGEPLDVSGYAPPQPDDAEPSPVS